MRDSRTDKIDAIRTDMLTAIGVSCDEDMVKYSKEAFENGIELEHIFTEDSEEFGIIAEAIGKSGWVPGM